MNNINEKVISIISELLGMEEGEITPESRLIEDLQVDSVDRAALLIALEEEYNRKIEDDALTNIRTVGDIITFIQVLLSEMETSK